MALIYCFAIALSLLSISSFALPLPFAFGNSTNDIFLRPADEEFSALINLTHPMSYLNTNVTFVRQFTNGYIILYGNGPNFAGLMKVYLTDIDTSNGGVDQNQIWLRVGNRTEDLNIARDIIAGSGTLFAPQAVIVATWYKVEAFNRRVGAQNTFQMAMAYSATGETWLILAYKQLQFFQAGSFPQATVGYTNNQDVAVFDFIPITSNASMNFVLSVTNCNRPGIYAYPINKGGPTKAPTKAPTKTPTKAPTKAPTKTPTKALTKTPTKAPTKTPTKAPLTAPTPSKCGLLGRSIFCPLTLCGVFGRMVGLCNS